MKLIKNDPFVADLTNVKQLAAINEVVQHIDEGRIEKAFLFETIHGFIVEFHLKSHCYVNQRRAERLDTQSVSFWASMAPKFRWFELSEGIVSIALHR